MFHIVFAADDNYIKYASVLMYSIIKNTDVNKKFQDFFIQNDESAPGGGDLENLNLLKDYKKLDFKRLNIKEQSEGYIFHILTDFVSDENLIKLKNLEIELDKIYPCKIQVDVLQNLNFDTIPEYLGSHLTYFRASFSRFVNTSMCLYLDTDMLVLSDLRELFTLDLTNYFAAVVPIWDTRNYIVRHKTNQNFDYRLSRFYFNAGLLLFNVNLYKQENIESKFLEIAKNYHCSSDEPIFNMLFDKKVLFLPREYNFIVGFFMHERLPPQIPYRNENLFYYARRWSGTRHQIFCEKTRARIIHFTGGRLNPWDSPFYALDKDFQILDHCFLDVWQKYAKETPIFKQYFIERFEELQQKSLKIYSVTLGKKLKDMNKKIIDIWQNIEEIEKILEYHFLKKIQIGATERIRNHLAYKLGEVLITYSKNFKGLMKLPFVLKRISKEHKFEKRVNQSLVKQQPNLKPPPLDQYVDYQEGLKLKESLTYKLGSSLIKANQTWYKGGYVKFILEIMRLINNRKAKK